MKKLFTIYLSFLILNFVSAQQVPLTIISEHFTNTKCGVCASRNPGFNTNLNSFPQVLRISIHPSAPYATCVLSQQNKIDNDARTNYYGVYGSTPKIMMNGELVSTGANYADSNILKPYFIKTSSFMVKSVIAKKGTDSVTVSINIKKVDTSSLTTAILFMGIIEDTVFVNGGNGELKHYNTLRKSLQQSINLPSLTNDSIIFSYTTMIQSIWNIKRMFSIGILNHVTNKKLIQAGFSGLLKDAIISGLGNQIDQQNLSIKIYPNPATYNIQIEGINTRLEYKLYRVDGIIVSEGFIYENAIIPTHILENGVYWLRMTGEGVDKMEKVLIQR